MAFESPIQLAEVEQRLIQRLGLYEFVKRAWPVVEPAPYVDSRHIELVCAHLEAVSRGECTRLVINIPPGCSKSLLVSVFWPAWDWIACNPGRKWMVASFDLSLTLRDADRLRDLITSDWYQARFGPSAPRVGALGWRPVSLDRSEPSKKVAKTDKGKSFFRLSGGGYRFSTMVRGRATGWHCDFQVMDDPIKPSDIQAGGDQARLALEKVRQTWATTFASRKANPATFARVVVMQRLHEHDLAATCEAEGYTVLSLPMEYDPARHCRTAWGEDWRTVPGELLNPDRFPAAIVEKTKTELGPRAAAAQLQQNPTAETGAIFDRGWFTRRWTEIPAGCVWWQSWDCTFKNTAGADYVVGQTWARLGVNHYLVDQVRARMSFTATVQAIRDMVAKWPEARRVLVEDKANGSAVMDALRGEIPGLVAVEPLGGKVVRATATTGLWQAGQVWLPNAPWVGDFVEEHAAFPLGVHDDQVDATSQALTHAAGKGRKADRYKGLGAGSRSAGAVLRVRLAPGTTYDALNKALGGIKAVGLRSISTMSDATGYYACTLDGDRDLAIYCVTSRGLGSVA